MSSLETLSIRQIFGKLLRYGQYFMVYPSAFLARPRDVILPSAYKVHWGGETLQYEDLILTTRDRVILRCYFLRATAPSPPGYPWSENVGNQLNTQVSNEALENLQVENVEPNPNTQVSEAPNTPQAENEENQPIMRVSDQSQDTPHADKVEERSTVQVYNDDTPQVENVGNQRNQQFFEACGTIILFHGNAMDIGDCFPPATTVRSRGYNVLMVSYRGYAHSSGSPSEKGLRIDAQTAFDYVTTDANLSRTPIILFGHSLGGAVAIDLASRNPSKIHALVVENTFTSLPDIVRGWPLIAPFAFLCHQKWNSAAKIRLIPTSTPIFMMSGGMDQVVPPKHMDALWKECTTRGLRKGKKDDQNPALLKSRKDRFHRFFVASHSDMVWQETYFDVVEDFLSSLRDPVAHDTNVEEALPHAESGSH